MENLLAHLKTKAFQSRTIALMENGTWAPMAAKLMRAELDGMKNITVCDAVVTIRSAANAAGLKCCKCARIRLCRICQTEKIIDTGIAEKRKGF